MMTFLYCMVVICIVTVIFGIIWKEWLLSLFGFLVFIAICIGIKDSNRKFTIDKKELTVKTYYGDHIVKVEDYNILSDKSSAVVTVVDGVYWIKKEDNE